MTRIPKFLSLVFLAASLTLASQNRMDHAVWAAIICSLCLSYSQVTFEEP